ncbi:MAG: pseudouridine-5'-phosphate glycosidase [Xanthomonadales bacterium]|nr:pseudouridine-5'-phosphate glycosidase [Xanthomonadales bacterium]
MSRQSLQISEAVLEALDQGRPVLALESTIISHGMPWPRNLEMARAVEQLVRDAGAVPATVAVMDGSALVGLDDHQLELLARSGTGAVKCSRRDLPFVIEQGQVGSTTVAATMILARMAGIRVFATGGIGGVHRGAAQSMDISADLLELARSDMAVVCAGPKAILDIGLTLEYLETHGVPVAGFRCDRVPAFYVRDSGYRVGYRVDSARELASILRRKWSMALRGGVLVVNPVPESHALPEEQVEAVVAAALREAEEQGVAGRNLTPFLLARIERLTEGSSLDTNVALMRSNARVGAEIASALAGVATD